LLVWRQALQTYRGPRTTYVALITQLVMALVIGIIFLQLGHNQKSIHDRLGAMFIILISQMFTNAQTTLTSFPLERSLFLIEYSNRMYGVFPYFMAKSLIDIPGLLILPVIFGVITYWMIGFQSRPGNFFIWLAFLIMMANLGQALGFTISAGLDLEQALPLMPLIIIPFALLGGFFLNPDSTPVYLDWLQRLSIFYWSFAGLVINEFRSGLTLNCDSDELTAQGTCPITDGNQEVYYLAFDSYQIWECILILLGMYLFMRLLTYGIFIYGC